MHYKIYKCAKIINLLHIMNDKVDVQTYIDFDISIKAKKSKIIDCLKIKNFKI